MTSSEDRFSSIGAQKGTALHVVTMAMRNVAQAIDQLYDTSLPEVRGAFQRFDQGLSLLKGVGPEGYAQLEEAEGDGEQGASEVSGGGVPYPSESEENQEAKQPEPIVKAARPARGKKA